MSLVAALQRAAVAMGVGVLALEVAFLGGALAIRTLPLHRVMSRDRLAMLRWRALSVPLCLCMRLLGRHGDRVRMEVRPAGVVVSILNNHI